MQRSERTDEEKYANAQACNDVHQSTAMKAAGNGWAGKSTLMARIIMIWTMNLKQIRLIRTKSAKVKESKSKCRGIYFILAVILGLLNPVLCWIVPVYTLQSSNA
jgi:hypothetical protein